MNHKFCLHLNSEMYDRVRWWLMERNRCSNASHIFDILVDFVPSGVDGRVVTIGYQMTLLHGYSATCNTFIHAHTFGKIVSGEPTDLPQKNTPLSVEEKKELGIYADDDPVFDRNSGYITHNYLQLKNECEEAQTKAQLYDLIAKLDDYYNNEAIDKSGHSVLSKRIAERINAFIEGES